MKARQAKKIFSTTVYKWASGDKKYSPKIMFKNPRFLKAFRKLKLHKK